MEHPPSHKEPVTHFRMSDLVTLISRLNYRKFTKPSRAESFLNKQIVIISRFSEELAQYPNEVCEELDFTYRTLDALSLNGPELIEDLAHCSWPGFVVAAWLTILEPTPDCCTILNRRKEQFPHNRWLAELAEHSLNDLPENENNKVISLAIEFKTIMAGIPKKLLPIRKAPNKETIEAFEGFREEVRKKYRKGGLEETSPFLKASEFAELFMTYDEWRRHNNRS